MCRRSQSTHTASSSSGANVGATPRSEASARSPSPLTIDTTTPVAPPATGPTSSTPRSTSSRETSSPVASSPRLAMHRASAPRAAAHAATFAACPPAPARVRARTSPPGASGSSSRTITSSMTSPRVAIRIRTIVPWKATTGLADCARSSSGASSVRALPSPPRAGAGISPSAAASSGSIPPGSPPSRAPPATGSFSSRNATRPTESTLSLPCRSMSTAAQTATSSSASSRWPRPRPRCATSAAPARSSSSSTRWPSTTRARASIRPTTARGRRRRAATRAAPRPTRSPRSRSRRRRRPPPPATRLLERLIADDAARPEEAGARSGRLRRGVAEHFLHHLDVLLGRVDVPVVGGAAQAAVHDVAGAELHPAELHEVPGGHVGRDRRKQVRPVERQREEARRARELRKRRLHDRLLVLLPLEVRPGRVELVLSDARVDERRVPVHVLRPLREAPAGPLLATRLRRVRTVEAVGEDLLGDVHGDAADGVDELLELLEVDEHNVVHLQLRAEQRVHRLDGELRTAELHRRVDLLVHPVDGHEQVARNGEIRDAVAARVCPQEHHRVGVVVGAAAGLAVRRVVGPEQEDVRRRVEHQPVLLCEHRRRPGRQPFVRIGDAAVHGQVPGDAPDDGEDDQGDDGEQRPATPRPRTPLPPTGTLPALGLPVALLAAGKRHLSLLATTLVDAVRLLARGGHPAGYGTRSS